MNYGELGTRLESLLGLQRHAVAITFLETPPPGISRVSAVGPASCAYWKLASDGQIFYTTSEDHLSCTIGAYTHGVPLTPEKETELKSTIGLMVGLNYLGADEVARIPHRSEAFQVAVYSPLSQSSGEPELVVVRGNAKHVMLLTEAALAAGIGPQEGIMVRPTCAFLPATLQSGAATPSFGCIGNRVYTDLADDELYFAIPGAKIPEVTAQLEKIVAANKTLESFHQQRCACA